MLSLAEITFAAAHRASNVNPFTNAIKKKPQLPRPYAIWYTKRITHLPWWALLTVVADEHEYCSSLPCSTHIETVTRCISSSEFHTIHGHRIASNWSYSGVLWMCTQLAKWPWELKIHSGYMPIIRSPVGQIYYRRSRIDCTRFNRLLIIFATIIMTMMMLMIKMCIVERVQRKTLMSLLW